MGDESAQLVSTLKSVCEFDGVQLDIDKLGTDDREALEESEYLRGPGVFFEISEPRHTGDASRLWNEAMVSIRQYLTTGECDAARLPNGLLRDLSTTALGRASTGVLGTGSTAGIALVEGGIEEIFVAPHETCLRRIVCDVAKPWAVAKLATGGVARRPFGCSHIPCPLAQALTSPCK
jgi:hypothetical protein